MTELKLKKLAQAAAYYAIIIVAIALVLNYFSIFGEVASILYKVANIIAYILVAISAFFYVKIKRNLVYMITYIVAVVLMVIFMIIPFFN